MVVLKVRKIKGSQYFPFYSMKKKKEVPLDSSIPPPQINLPNMYTKFGHSSEKLVLKLDVDPIYREILATLSANSTKKTRHIELDILLK